MKKYKIAYKHLLRTIMMLIMMGGASSAWCQEVEEKAIYQTDFTDWNEVSHKNADHVEVEKQTLFTNENFTFTLTGVGVYPKGTNSKFASYTGFMETAKYPGDNISQEPSAVTSALKSITRIVLHQEATGTSGRGIKISVKGDGDADWKVLHDTDIKNGGKDLDIAVNRTNCQIKFENIQAGLNQNVYITDLAIYGNVEKKENVTVSYYNPDGSLIGTEQVAGNSKLKFKYGAQDVTLPGSNYKFRGWFNNNTTAATKVPEGETLIADTKLYAKATPIELTEYGDEHTYNLLQNNFYPEDHDGLITITGGVWSDGTHGWKFENGGTIQVEVARNASIDFTQCNNSNNGTIAVTANGSELASFDAKAASDSHVQTVRYDGGIPTTVTIQMPAGSYLHSLHVSNMKLVIVSFESKNAEGEVPTSIKADKDGKVTIPASNFLYREGWTFTDWWDGTQKYEAGKTYTFDQDVALTTRWKENQQDITEANQPVEVVWPFDYTEAPAINMNNKADNKDYTVLSGNIYIDEQNQEQQDVKMTIDTQTSGKGKIDNTEVRAHNLPGKGAQINDGTSFTIPAEYGMKVKIQASTKVDTQNSHTEAYFNKDANNAQITVTNDNGYQVPEADITYEGNKTMIVTYKGEATSLHVNFVKAGSTKNWGFYESITAIYPVLPHVVSKNIITNTDFADPDKYPNEKAENAGEVTQSSTATHPNTGKRYRVGDAITLVGKAGYGYTLQGFRVQGTDTYLTATKDAEGNLTTTYTITSDDNDKFESSIPVEAVYERQTLHKVIIKSANTTLGDVSLSPVYDNFYREVRAEGSNNKPGALLQIESWFTEGTTVTATSEAATDYTIDYWAEENSTTQLSTKNSYSFTVKAGEQDATTILAYFKPGYVGTVIFDISKDAGIHVNQATEGLYQGVGSRTPEALTDVRSFIIPTNYTFYKNVDDNDQATEYSYTLDHWELKGDPSQQYVMGKQYSFSKEGETLTLVPVFTYNPATADNRVNNPVIRYDFGRMIHDYYDPNTGETRKVSGQQVNIGNNENLFWSAKTWVYELEGTQTRRYWRSVPIWCKTGKTGYIRNGDFDDWCAIGPGTTFWVASNAGAKISLLSYAPITTTTIDGKVPTLDKELTDSLQQASGSKHMYVYSYTTQNAADRVAIVIGDDYSYYQWIELHTLAANWMNCHTEVNYDARGHIDDITPMVTGEGHEMKELENGDYSFHKGERVRLTFYRKKGYKLDKIIGLYLKDDEGNPITLLQMNDDKTVSMLDFDDKTLVKVAQNADGSWGTATGAGKTRWVLRTYDEDSYLSEDSVRTKYELEFDITSHRAMQLQFQEMAETYYITNNPGEFASGVSPDPEWVEKGDLFEIPRNQTLYFEGNTLDHWIDGNNKEYKIGQRYEATGDNLRMFPAFRPNGFDILDLKHDATATWYFAKDDKAPTINYETTTGILVTQLAYEGDTIDMKIDLDGTKGKFNNTSADHPERIQINSGSIVQFPSTPGCTATLESIQKDGTVSISGKDAKVVESTDNKGKYFATNVCMGETAYEKMVFKTGIYSRLFQVTYKEQTAKKAEIQTLTCKDGDNETTLTKAQIDAMVRSDNTGDIVFTVSPWKNADEAMPILTGTATEDGTVSVSTATLTNKACAVTVKNKSGITVETYRVRFEFTTPDDTPTYEQLTVNGQTYTATSNEIYDVPQSGVIKVKFNRTMEAANVENEGITYSGKAGREQEFKYWDMPFGQTITLKFTPADGIFKDIYGKVCQQELTLILHIKENDDRNHHHPFDFIVGKDGTIDDAIEAANHNTKTGGHRYYIFVPDGEYQLTGNTTISYRVEGVKKDDLPKDELGNPRDDRSGKNNGKTEVTMPNISLIGQSKEGVTIWNHPVIEGISYTATLNIDSKATDFYAQDLTLENRFDYWGSLSGQDKGGAGRAAAFADYGNRTTLKNVALMSWQDTYYSANGADGYRGYMESCDLAGVVDWICGSGDIWFERCNLIVRDRSGNNLAAPHTEVGQSWGYVFSNCTIKPETDHPTQLKGKDWTLARPWGSSPACTFLNTTMYTQPRNYGWAKMGSEPLVLRFHEYHSMDGNGNQINLNTRSLAACLPAPGSDDCVLVDTTGYNIRNVLGGTDAYEPHRLCQQINAKTTATSDEEERSVPADVEGVRPIEWDAQLELDDDVLSWKSIEQALCYFIFKCDENTGKWIYQANTTESSLNLNSYGSGYYCVRAANQRGGLGTPTDAILYEIADPYELEIKPVGNYQEDGEPYGWTTICLPFNAKKPSEVKVYAATADETHNPETLVTDFTLTLSEVNVIDSLKGYVVYGPVGTHTFHPTSSTCDKATILSGNATSSAISATNISCYVLANKTWGLGFYKYAGATLAANRGWLPQNMVGEEEQFALASGRKAIRFRFADDTTPVRLPSINGASTTDEGEDAYYNLAGQKVEKPTHEGVYISKKKGKFVIK